MSALPSWARKGVKVVCVDGGPLRGGFGNETPVVADAVYTIRDATIIGIRLREIVNPTQAYLEGHMECGYAISRFRPLVSTKTEAQDLAHFRKYLHQNAPEAVE